MRRLAILAVVFLPPVVLAEEPDDAVGRQLAGVVRDPRLSLWARVEAARSLGKLGPRAAVVVPDLTAQLERLRGRELEPLQEAVIDALGQIGSPARGSLPAFARSAGRSVDIDLALKRSTDAILAAADPTDIDSLTRQLLSRDSSLRLRAVKALGNLGPAGRAAVPNLIAVLTDLDPDVRRGAIAALRLVLPDARPGGPVVRAIAVDLADPDPVVRASAARSLGRFGTAALPAAAAVETLLADPDSDVRRAAADALARISRP